MTFDLVSCQKKRISIWCGISFAPFSSLELHCRGTSPVFSVTNSVHLAKLLKHDEVKRKPISKTSTGLCLRQKHDFSSWKCLILMYVNVQIKLLSTYYVFMGKKQFTGQKINSIRCRKSLNRFTGSLKTQMQKIIITENQIQTWIESYLLHNSIIKGDICVHLVKCSLTVVAV